MALPRRGRLSQVVSEGSQMAWPGRGCWSQVVSEGSQMELPRRGRWSQVVCESSWLCMVLESFAWWWTTWVAKARELSPSRVE